MSDIIPTGFTVTENEVGPAVVRVYRGTVRGKRVEIKEVEFGGRTDYEVRIDGRDLFETPLSGDFAKRLLLKALK